MKNEAGRSSSGSCQKLPPNEDSDRFEFDFVEREATPESAIKLGIRLR